MQPRALPARTPSDARTPRACTPPVSVHSARWRVACAPPSGRRQLTDLTTFLKICYVVFAGFFTLCGCVGVLLHHVMAPQKAPVVAEAEPVELYREVKAVG